MPCTDRLHPVPRKEPCPVTQDSQKSRTAEMEMGKLGCWELTLSLPQLPHHHQIPASSGLPMTEFPSLSPAPSPTARLQCPARAAVGARELQAAGGGGHRRSSTAPDEPCLTGNHRRRSKDTLKRAPHSQALPFYRWGDEDQKGHDLPKVGKTALPRLNPGLPGEPTLIFCFLTLSQCSDPTLRSQMGSIPAGPPPQ